MKPRIKTPRCDNCKFYQEDKNYKGEGICLKDGRYTREHRVCDLLKTDKERRDAKINRYARYME